MPVVAQLGNVSYVICAMVGGILAINGIGSFTLGGLASFLTFNKSFNMPINQVSQQFNSMLWLLQVQNVSLIFLDEKPEVDEGYVTLVNAKRGKRCSYRIRQTYRPLGMEAFPQS